MNAIAKWTGMALATAALGLLVPASLQAAELVMFERAGCIWCARWDREVAPIYHRTPEGRAAPLRRVDLDTASGAQPGLAGPVRFTPTFVVFDKGRELGRVTGYISDGAFWGLLGMLLADIAKPIAQTGGVAATTD